MNLKITLIYPENKSAIEEHLCQSEKKIFSSP